MATSAYLGLGPGSVQPVHDEVPGVELGTQYSSRPGRIRVVEELHHKRADVVIRGCVYGDRFQTHHDHFYVEYDAIQIVSCDVYITCNKRWKNHNVMQLTLTFFELCRVFIGDNESVVKFYKVSMSVLFSELCLKCLSFNC